VSLLCVGDRGEGDALRALHVATVAGDHLTRPGSERAQLPAGETEFRWRRNAVRAGTLHSQ
jgi:hypothetical protein